MLNRVIRYFKNLSKNQHKILVQLNSQNNQFRELEWAHIFHDSIRGDKAIENLSLNVGRWSGNYAFFYVLNRILKQFKPMSILELGLGESTKFISTFIDAHLKSTQHTVIEHDNQWVFSFKENFILSDNTKIVSKDLIEKEYKGHKVLCYDDIGFILREHYDFILIDGPFGSDRFSRIDTLDYIRNISKDTNYVILLDDTGRVGEQDTLKDIVDILKQNDVPLYLGFYSGNKSCTVLSNNKYVSSF